MLTGRWTNRTGVWHTFFARAMMYEDEVTIADHLQAAGYATGMFGKWHLGDHYPYRPQDRGFDEVYCLKGGATGVTADYWNNDYFDDYHYHNEKLVKSKGYSTDVFFAAGERFIAEQAAKKKPFFAYISTTAPHKPWICPPKYSALYPDQEKKAAAFYGMVTNIDDNVGRLRARLTELGVADNTIFIFTTDNGSVGPKKFNAGMRGGKISPYDGGHRVPFALHWPEGGFSEHVRVKELTHMTDVLPTLLELCEVKPTKEVPLDGRSITKLLTGKGDASFDWENRVVISDSQRVQHPKKWKDSAVMSVAGVWSKAQSSTTSAKIRDKRPISPRSTPRSLQNSASGMKTGGLNWNQLSRAPPSFISDRQRLPSSTSPACSGSMRSQHGITALSVNRFPPRNLPSSKAIGRSKWSGRATTSSKSAAGQKKPT